MNFATAETRYPKDPDAPGLPVAERAPARHGVRPITGEVDAALVIYAFCNHGRWIAQCPFCDSAQFASWTDPRFLCAQCGNVTIDGRWLPIRWPCEAVAIETALEPRPTENRNWRPGEMVAGLRRENVEHGLGG